MIDLRKILTPRGMAEIKAQSAEVMSFQNLDPAQMAREILDDARTLRECGAFSSDHRYSYDESVLYRLIPALAVRVDPSIELQSDEIPKEDEAKDVVTTIENASDEKIRNLVDSYLRNSSFRRAKVAEVSDEISNLADVAFGATTVLSKFSVFADTIFPGLSPERVTPDDRAPLEGTFVISSRGGRHEQCVAYTEDPDAAERYLEAARRIMRDGEAAADLVTEEMPLHELERIEKASFVELQNFGCSTLARIERQDVDAAPGF